MNNRDSSSFIEEKLNDLKNWKSSTLFFLVFEIVSFLHVDVGLVISVDFGQGYTKIESCSDKAMRDRLFYLFFAVK